MLLGRPAVLLPAAAAGGAAAAAAAPAAAAAGRHAGLTAPKPTHNLLVEHYPKPLPTTLPAVSLDLWKMATEYMLGKACIAEVRLGAGGGLL